MSAASHQLRSANQALRQILDSMTDGEQVLPDRISSELLRNLQETLDQAAFCRRAADECSDADLVGELNVYRELLIRLQTILPSVERQVQSRAETLRHDLERIGEVIAWNRTNQITRK